MIVLFLAIFQSFIRTLGHNAVTLEDIGYIKSATALCEVDRSIGADIFVGLVAVAVTHDKHLAQVIFFACGAEQFILNKTYTGEAPACTRLILILDWSGLVDFDVCKFEAADSVGLLGIALGIRA